MGEKPLRGGEKPLRGGEKPLRGFSNIFARYF
jgi:hypothetical protein